MPRPTLRRQWGAEKRLEPLEIVHARPSDAKIARSRLAIVITIALWVSWVTTTVIRGFLQFGLANFHFTLDALAYLAIMTSVTLSALMYLVARAGALKRFRDHRRVPRAELERHFAEAPTSITVLVPSYAEEPDVVRSTLMSAALQEFPELRIVLLLDDSPSARGEDSMRIDRTIAMVDEIRELLREPAACVQDALDSFELRAVQLFTANDVDDEAIAGWEELVNAAKVYAWAANWLDEAAEAEAVDDHVDVFFTEQVIGKLADELRETGAALQAASRERETGVTYRRLGELYQRLVWTFRADLSVFQRKAWASLSHEANKAMNLNSYIALMGNEYRIDQTPDGPVLIPSDNARVTVSFPDSEFLLTLDADSILLREYCLRLVYFLRQPENERVAVTQTPYSSFRGARTRIERLAAATTDVQHILHQGMTAYGATFWVGANAVIRKAALDDIVEVDHSSGYEIRRYVQDRTVIEDTESSIDIARHGWSLVNYPERLSYSATPPDFGSLVVQRRRWANGGLLILPTLFAQIRERRQRGERTKASEFLLRLNYTASIAWSSVSLVFLLAFPFDDRLLSVWIIAGALPYFISQASDLRYCGYKWTDMIRMYGFNLILLPVNLAGVMKSLQQALTSRKIPFARTPKVKDRTAAPLLYLVAPAAIVLFSLFSLWRACLNDAWGTASFSALNAVLAGYAIISYIGVGPFIVDLWVGATNWMFVSAKPAPSSSAAPARAVDWRTVLYQGAGQSVHAVGHVPPRREPSRVRASEASQSAAAASVVAVGREQAA